VREFLAWHGLSDTLQVQSPAWENHGAMGFRLVNLTPKLVVPTV